MLRALSVVSRGAETRASKYRECETDIKIIAGQIMYIIIIIISSSSSSSSSSRAVSSAVQYNKGYKPANM